MKRSIPSKIRALRDLAYEHIVFTNGENGFYQVCVAHEDMMRTEIQVNGRLYGRESTRQEAVEIFRDYYKAHDSVRVDANVRMFEGWYTIFGIPDWDDISHEIWDEEVDECLKEYLENEFWKKYYETAPGNLCKRYIAYEFYLSEGGDEAAESELQAMEKRLTLEDWEHLYRFCGNNPRKAVIQQHMDELQKPPQWMIPSPMEGTSWKRLYDGDGNLAYEGFASEDNVPTGAGTAFFPNGNRYKEGIWGKKGLLTGREYYPTGQLKFEGVYLLNPGYGPNYPVYGRFFSEKGILVFDGRFKTWRSGVGWPSVTEPEEYGNVLQNGAPHVSGLREKQEECLIRKG